MVQSVGLGVQAPDFGQALARGLALREATDRRESENMLRALLADPAQAQAMLTGDTNALALLAGIGTHGLQIAAPMMAQAGLRRFQEQKLDIERQRLENEIAHQRATLAQAGWQTVQGGDGRLYRVNVRSGAAMPIDIPGAPAPEPSLGDNERARTADFLTRVAPRIISGVASPYEIEMFRAAGEIWQRRTFDPSTGTFIQGMALPPLAAEAFDVLSRRDREPSVGVPAPVASSDAQPDVGAAAPPRVMTNTGSVTTPPEPRRLTETERVAAGFADRMEEAERILRDLEASGYNPTNLRDVAAARLPAGNYLRTPQGQQYYQAAQNWVRANLRKESGAVIGAEEMAEEIRTYFPQPGDTPEVIAQKARARAIATENMRRNAGGGIAGPGGVGVAEPPARSTSLPAPPPGFQIVR